jgi:hypothetical protein
MLRAMLAVRMLLVVAGVTAMMIAILLFMSGARGLALMERVTQSRVVGWVAKLPAWFLLVLAVGLMGYTFSRLTSPLSPDNPILSILVPMVSLLLIFSFGRKAKEDRKADRK